MIPVVLNSNNAIFKQHNFINEDIFGNIIPISILSIRKDLPIDKDSEVALLENIITETEFKNDQSENCGFTMVGKIIKAFDKIPYIDGRIRKANESRKKLGKEPIEYFKYKFEMKFDVIISEPYSLDEIAYSLTKTEQYFKPYKSYSHQFTILGEQDIKTIKDQNVFVSRTILGIILRCLPQENYFEFINFAISKSKQFSIQTVPLELGIELLFEYIDKVLLTSFDMISEISRISENEISEITNISEIGTAFDMTSSDDSLLSHPDSIIHENYRDQAKKIKLFTNIFKGKELFKNLQSDLSQSRTSESDFKKLFIKSPWPIKISA